MSLKIPIHQSWTHLCIEAEQQLTHSDCFYLEACFIQKHCIWNNSFTHNYASFSSLWSAHFRREACPSASWNLCSKLATKTERCISELDCLRTVTVLRLPLLIHKPLSKYCITNVGMSFSELIHEFGIRSVVNHRLEVPDLMFNRVVLPPVTGCSCFENIIWHV